VATRYKRQPKADDYIYHAPLMNTYSDSRVCVGSADCPDNADIENMAGWESVIFETIFTHTNHDFTLQQKSNERTSTKELHAFYKSIKSDTSFPKNRLNAISELTLEEWIQK
jgi:PRTRC genetic system protein B